MQLKRMVKHALLGRPGDIPRYIHRGLLRGQRFYVDTTSKSQRLLGLDEREIAAPIAQYAARAAAALDIGANDGWYSLFFAAQPQIQKVFAFEPSAGLAQRLKQNFELNAPELAAKLTVVPKFVGDKDDNEWCTVDGLAAELPRPILLKIDVDGGEMEVLRGAERTMSSGQCLIVLETHSLELEENCQRFLQAHGYDVQLIKNGWYRKIIPEGRTIAHNRWLTAERR